MLAIILVIMAGYVSPLRSLYTTSRQIDNEQTSASALQKQHDTLVLEKQRLQDNTYIEQVARRDLGLVLPGEQAYVVKDLNTRAEQAAAPPPPAPEKSLPGRVLDDLKSLLP